MKTIRVQSPCAFLLLLALLVPSAAHSLTVTQIPVIVNLYPDSGTTEDQAREAVKEANKALKQANMQLVVVKAQNSDGGDAGSDGAFDKEERKAARTYGGKELEKLPNKKGIKLSFGKTPTTETPANPGISLHRDPTVIVSNRGNAALTGETIAHEVGHALTLGPGHTVAPGQTASAGGHTPNTPGETGKDNLMAPRQYRSGTALTAQQIAEVQTRKYVVGKCATQFSYAFPGIKDKQQFGAKTDETRDSASVNSIYDLDQTFLTSLEDSASIQAQITVDAPLTSAGAVEARYTLGFDADGNDATGIVHGSLSGVDRVAAVNVAGVFGTPGFSLTGVVLDAVTQAVIAPLTSLSAVIDEELSDDDVPGDPTATSFLFDIPKQALDIPLSATILDMIATAGLGDLVFDESLFTFNLKQWQDDPTLNTSGNGVPSPGSPYQFSVEGLAPSSPFTLFLDMEPVFSGTLDAVGAFSGSFLFPSEVPVDTFHFLTAQDATGEFAYNMTCPTPEPVSMLMLGSGLGLLAARSARGRKRACARCDE